MIIDADAHWAPPAEFFKEVLVDDLYQKYLDNNQRFSKTFADYKSELFNNLSIDRQLLNFYGPTVGFRYKIQDLYINDMAKTYNKNLETLCTHNPEFDHTCWLPLQNIEVCETMLQESATQSSFAVHVGEQVPWGFIPQYKDLFEKIAKQGLPIYLHFANHNDFPSEWNQNLDSLYEEFAKYYPRRENAGIGKSPTWKITIASFILSGLLEKHNLKVVVAEQGLQWLTEFQEVMIKITNTDPLPYFKKFFWFTTEPEEKNFFESCEILGFDRLLFATDWPHGNMDIGGTNMYHDVSLLKNFLTEQRITQEQYNQISHQNYLNLKNRAVI